MNHQTGRIGMRPSRALCSTALVVIGLLFWSARVPAAGVPKDEAAIRHALSRLTFGPRPDDVEKVRRMGLSTWLDRQLTPSKIDDHAAESRLRPSPTRPERFDSMMEARRYGRESVEVLAANKITRAVYTERQLEELLVDFWFNHFNVFAGKGRTGLYVAEYERDAIRPHVLGKFRDLLGATAKSPAMLFYLDNWLSADPEAAERIGNRRGPNQQAGNARRRGLNENYGRELLELHTLGVGGGYTQKDVIEVARAFTGWTIAPPDGGRGRAGRAGGRFQAGIVEDGEFRFVPALHDRGDKMVLGQQIRAGGMEEGQQVLDILALHPATARHIARELAQRFVSDTPPDALVARVAKRFTDTRGDLREVMKTLITSPEFFAADARNAKVKTPIEFVASAYRATGRELSEPRPVLRALQQLGEMPYMCQPPTGYDDTADTWINAGALVARMNIAQQIAGPQQAATIGGPEFQRR
jgi:uncharacterized protein (DUF1800 family)